MKNACRNPRCRRHSTTDAFRRSQGGGVVSVLLLLATAGCASDARGQSDMDPGEMRVDTQTVRTEDGREIVVEFGRLGVPENRVVPGSGTIEIAYARLLGSGTGTPLFYLAGGPGDAAVWQARDADWIVDWVPFLGDRDVVLIDQRGTGESRPRLRWRADAPPPNEVFTDRDVALEHFSKLVRDARTHFESEGRDLDGYTSVQSVEDLNDLRAALGYEAISMLGFSYGTHLAIAYAKRHPEHLADLVLSNVEGPDQTLKLPFDFDTQLRKLSLAVAADPLVGPDVPDLYGLYLSVREELDRTPMLVEVETSGGETLEVPVGSFFLDYIVRRDIGDASDLPVFPRLLHSISEGDPSVLRWFVQRRVGVANSVNAMSGLMDAASGATEGRRRLIEWQEANNPFGDPSNFLRELDEVWGAPDLGHEYRAPLVSPTRTLLLSGEWDWNTPPYQAEQLRWGLPNATHLIVGGAGHEQVLGHGEIRAAVVAFLAGEDVSGVRASRPPLRFIPLEGQHPEVRHPAIPGN